MSTKKRNEWIRHRDRTSSRRRSIREREERENAEILKGIVIVLAKMVAEKEL